MNKNRKGIIYVHINKLNGKAYVGQTIQTLQDRWGRGSLYSTLDGLGASRYYMVDAVTSLIAGYAFIINPYLPIVLCLIGNIISTILASKFKRIQMPDDDVEENNEEDD